MPKVAALPMYDLPELREANETVWSAIGIRLMAAGVTQVPLCLSRNLRPDLEWTDPDLVLSQTCGYPLVTRLVGRVQVVATPVYDAEGCDGARHRSALVVRDGVPATGLAHLRGRRCAINDHASNTGMNLLRDAVAPLAGKGQFFNGVVVTGSHAASVEAVVTGEADLAAIDCVTLHHLRRFRPDLTDRLRVIAWTRSSPGLPLITSVTTSLAELRALRAALTDIVRDTGVQAALQALRIKRFQTLPIAAYQQIRRLEDSARLRDYPELH